MPNFQWEFLWVILLFKNQCEFFILSQNRIRTCIDFLVCNPTKFCHGLFHHASTNSATWLYKNCYSKNILSTLISDKYFANYKQNGGFLLKHSVGSLPHNSEVDVPLTYADYYFIEGILRYLDLNKKWCSVIPAYYFSYSFCCR